MSTLIKRLDQKGELNIGLWLSIPTPKSLKRLEHEYSLKKALDPA
jgi:hypothetical protein